MLLFIRKEFAEHMSTVRLHPFKDTCDRFYMRLSGYTSGNGEPVLAHI